MEIINLAGYRPFPVHTDRNFPDVNYSILITGPVSRNFTYESQTISGFTINANANLSFVGDVYWMAKQFGEV